MEPNCASTYQDENLFEKTSNYYMFILEEQNLVQIRKFDSRKVMVYDSSKYLFNFISFEDGLTNEGRAVTQKTLNYLKRVSTWKIDQYKDGNYYVIRSSHENLTLGAIEYGEGQNLSVAFGLYDQVDPKSNLDDKLLFKIVELNYTLNVQIHSIDFDSSIQDDLIKKCSYFSSKSKTFTEMSCESVSSTLTDTITQSNSNSKETHSGTSSNVGAKGSGTIFGIGLEASASHSWDSGSSNSHTSENSNEQSNTKTETKDDTHSSSMSEDSVNSKTVDRVQGNEIQRQNQRTIDERIDKGGSRSKSYSIHKTVSLPPYTSVKISSYANWIDDLTIKYNLTLKFSAKSFRRLNNGEGQNDWRTVDKEFVAYLLKKHKFLGELLPNNGFDYFYGRVTGYMKASVGLDSVFIASETKLNQNL